MKFSFASAIKVLPTTLFVAFIVISCASSQPIMYPNETAKEAGNEQVKKDIDECIQLAEDSGAKSNDAGEVAKETAGSAAEGAATGAATGAIGGGDPATSAAIAVVSRGINGLFSGMRKSNQPSAAYKQIVERCLIEKGYEPVGWK